MSNVPVAKARAIGHQNAPLIDRDLVVVEDDLLVEEEVVSARTLWWKTWRTEFWKWWKSGSQCRPDDVGVRCT